MSETFDRSQLDGKDREQLSRDRVRARREVDQPDAQGRSRRGDRRRDRGRFERRPVRASTPRKVRSSRGVGDDDFASIAEEENALARRPRPGRRHGADPSRAGGRPATGGNGHDAATGLESNGSEHVGRDRGDDHGATATAPRADDRDRRRPTTTIRRDSDARRRPTRVRATARSRASSGATTTASANKRRRRRRGRDRERGPTVDGRGRARRAGPSARAVPTAATTTAAT